MRNRLNAITILLLCLALSPLARAQQTPDLLSERVLPASTVAAVILPDVTGAGDAFKQTALYEVFQDPEVQAMFAPIVREWLANWNTLTPMSPVKPEELAHLFTGEVALALSMDGQPGQPRPAIHIILKPRAVPAAQDAWQKIVAFLAATKAIRGQTPSGDGVLYELKKGSLAVTTRDNAIFFTLTHPALVADCHNELLARLAGPADNLARAHAYSSLINKLGRHNVIRVFFDPSRLYELNLVDNQATATIDVLGLRNAGPLLLGAGFQDRGIRLTAYLAAPAPRAGLLTFFNGAPLTDADLNIVPASATAFKTGRMNLAGLFDMVVSLVKTLGDPEPHEVDAAIAMADKELGLSIRNDVLGQFGDQYAFYRAGSSDGVNPVSVLLKVKDERAAAANIRKLMDAVAALIGREAQVNPAEWVRSAEIQRQGFVQVYANSILPAAVTPNLAFAKCWMLAALSARDVLAGARLALNPGAGILSVKEFKDLLQRMPPNRIVVAAVDSRAYAGSFLEWVQFLGDLGHMFAKIGIQNEKKPIPFRLTEPQWLDPGRFPSEDLLRSKLFGAITVVSADDQGVWFESFSAAGPIPPVMRPSFIGGGVAGPVQVPILAGILLPALARARGQAREVTAMNNLRQIAMGLEAMQADKAAYPASLADLQPNYIASDGVFLSPEGDPASAPKLKNGVPCSFHYVGAVRPQANESSAWVAYSRKSSGASMRSVLFYDGHVERMPEPLFRDGLKRQAQEVYGPLLKQRAPGLDPARVQAFLNDEFYDK